MCQMRSENHGHVHSVQRAKVSHEMFRVLPVRSGVQRQVVFQTQWTTIVPQLPR